MDGGIPPRGRRDEQRAAACAPAGLARTTTTTAARRLDDGDLPPGSDPDLLARYLTTLTFGLSVQAASGVPATELQALAATALRTWPPV